MATYVLVHGAWYGAWCWKRVRTALQAAGHEVFTPTLTGVGERSHLTSPDVNLSTHIADVVNLIKWEELSDVILCGHSYSGCVISGAADQVSDKIRALIYLDAFVIEDGECLFDFAMQEWVQFVRQQVQTSGEGWKVAPTPAEFFNVNQQDLAWVNAQCTSQSIACWEEPIKLTHRLGEIRNVTHILATGYPPILQPSHDRAKAKGWKTSTIDCGHTVMLDRPGELTELLLEYA